MHPTSIQNPVIFPDEPLPLLAAAQPRTSAEASPWFALRVKSRWEQRVADLVCGKGYEPFVPIYQVRRQWSDRVKQLPLPLIPGYVFCRMDGSAKALLVTTPGVLYIVSSCRVPAPIGDDEIAAIRTIAESGLAAQPHPFLNVGEQVTVQHGPLSGLQGILLRFRNENRIVVSVTLLRRSVAVEIDRRWVAPIC